MNGTDNITGKHISGLDHLRQSIRDILTTPIGSRVMLRGYGSQLFELVDRPVNKETISEFYAATVAALRKWEPRIKVQRVRINSIIDGKLSLELEAIYTPTGEVLTLEGLVAT